MSLPGTTTKLRVSSSTWTAALGWAVLLVLLGDTLLRGHWSTLLTFGPGALLAAWLLFAVFWAPGITLSDEAVSVRNVFATTQIPWSRVTDVAIASMVRVSWSDDDGANRRLTSWNAPGLPKLTAKALSDGDHPSALGPSGGIEERWAEHLHAPEASVHRHVHWIGIGVTAALAALTAVTAIT